MKITRKLLIKWDACSESVEWFDIRFPEGTDHTEFLQALEFNRDWSDWAKQKLARHPDCPVDLLELLAKDEDWFIRSIVAGHLNCPAHILEQLAKDEYWGVRHAVANYSNCPVDLLELLVKDEDWMIRYDIARHPNCPTATLELLAKDRHDVLRITAIRILKGRMKK